MYLVGRKLFYDIVTGDVIIDTRERKGTFIPLTVEEEIVRYKELSERNRDTFGVVELEYGAYAQDFAECSGYKVNPGTETILFSYPVPGEPETPPVFEAPLSVQVQALKAEVTETNGMILELSEFIFGGVN